jgi:O-antigen/teichoic acid export membrane protein
MPVRSIARSVLWNHAGRVGEFALTYLISVVVARQLGVVGNGVYATLLSLAQILLVTSSMGFEASLNKHIPQLDAEGGLAHTRHVLRGVLLTRFYVTLAVATLFSAIPHWFPNLFPPEIHGYLLWVILYAGARSFWPLLSMVVVAQFNTPLAARIGVFARGLELLGIILLGSSGQLTVASVLALLSGVGVLQTLAYMIFARHNIFGESVAASLKPVIAFGSIFWLNTIVDYFLGRQGDIFLLTTLLGEPVQASLYDVAYSLTQVAFLGATVGFAGVSFAAFARMALAGQTEMNRFYGALVRIVSLLSVPLYAFLVFNSPGVVSLVYSDDFLGAAPLVSGIALIRIVARLFAGGENAEYLLARGKVIPVVAVGVIAAAVNIGLDVSLIPGYGALGCVAATGIAAILANALGWVLVRRGGGPGLQIQTWSGLAFVSSAVSLTVSLWFPGDAPEITILAFVFHMGLTLLILTLTKPLRPGDLEAFGYAPEKSWLRHWIGTADSRPE